MTPSSDHPEATVQATGSPSPGEGTHPTTPMDFGYRRPIPIQRSSISPLGNAHRGPDQITDTRAAGWSANVSVSMGKPPSMDRPGSQQQSPHSGSQSTPSSSLGRSGDRHLLDHGQENPSPLPRHRNTSLYGHKEQAPKAGVLPIPVNVGRTQSYIRPLSPTVDEFPPGHPGISSLNTHDTQSGSLGQEDPSAMADHFLPTDDELFASYMNEQFEGPPTDNGSEESMDLSPDTPHSQFELNVSHPIAHNAALRTHSFSTSHSHRVTVSQKPA